MHKRKIKHKKIYETSRLEMGRGGFFYTEWVRKSSLIRGWLRKTLRTWKVKRMTVPRAESILKSQSPGSWAGRRGGEGEGRGVSTKDTGLDLRIELVEKEFIGLQRDRESWGLWPESALAAKWIAECITEQEGGWKTREKPAGDGAWWTGGQQDSFVAISGT